MEPVEKKKMIEDTQPGEVEYTAAMEIINRVKERNPNHRGLPDWARSGNAPTKTPVEPGVELELGAGEPDAADF